MAIMVVIFLICTFDSFIIYLCYPYYLNMLEKLSVSILI